MYMNGPWLLALLLCPGISSVQTQALDLWVMQEAVFGFRNVFFSVPTPLLLSFFPLRLLSTSLPQTPPLFLSSCFLSFFPLLPGGQSTISHSCCHNLASICSSSISVIKPDRSRLSKRQTISTVACGRMPGEVKSVSKSISLQLRGLGEQMDSKMHVFAGDTLKLFCSAKTWENSDKFQMISKHIRGSDIQKADSI